MITRFSVAAAALLAAYGLAQQAPQTSPDTIFYNGTIISVDESRPAAEAFAVKGDRFVAVGSNADVRALASSSTRIVDLRGHTVVPGLMDNHNHQYHVALLTRRGVDVQNVSSLAELLARLRREAAKADEGATVFTTTGWDASTFPEKRGPSRQELDAIDSRRPIVVYASRSRLHVNTAALRALGITRQSEVVEKVTVGKDAAGEPDGVLTGSPASVLNFSARVVPPPTLHENKALIKAVQADQHAMGLTGIRELQIHPDVMRAYFELWREHGLTMRTSIGLELNAGEEARLESMLAPWGVGPGFGDEWLRLDGVAEYNPGEQLREPYSDRDGKDVGELRVSEAQFTRAILTINRHGWRPAIHITGDRTLDLVLDAYEAADRERSIRGRRWIVEHIPLVHPEQIERMKRLGVVVSAQFQPYAGAAGLVRRFGKTRAERALPMRQLLDSGLVVSGGSDWPGAPNNPFVNIYYYVTRQTREMGQLGADQKLTRQEALRVETLNNAYMTFEENLKGSIAPQKLADFVILSNNLLTVPDEQILKIHALATYVGGRKVYARPGGSF
jgi:predicted amidohydrolase YtcJ